MSKNRHETEYSPLNGLVTLQEVCDALRVSRSTVKRWWKCGYFPGPIRLGRKPRWLESTVNRWIDLRNEEARYVQQ